MPHVAVDLVAGAVFGLSLAAPPGPMNAIIAEESVLRGWPAGFRAGLGAASADACFLVLALFGAVAVVGRVPAVRGVMVGAGGLLMLYFAAGAVGETAAFTGGRAGPAAVTGGDDGTGAAEDGMARHAGDETGAAGRRTDGGGTGSADAGIGTDGEARTDAGDGPGAGAGTAAGPACGKGFRKAFVLALTNPYQIVFWLTVGVGLLEPGTLDVLGAVPYAGRALSGLVVVRTGSPALLVGLFSGIGVWIVAFPAALVAAGRRVDALAPVVAGLSAAVLGLFGVVFLADAATTLLAVVAAAAVVPVAGTVSAATAALVAVGPARDRSAR